MKLRQIPQVPAGGHPARMAFDQAVKERIEGISGVRSGRIQLLKSDASQAEVIEKVNEIIAKLQGD